LNAHKYLPITLKGVERFNRAIEAMFGKVVQANQKNWDKQLPKVLLAYRTATHE